MASETLQQLVDLGLITQTKPVDQTLGSGFDCPLETYILEVTPLGKAVFKGIKYCCI